MDKFSVPVVWHSPPREAEECGPPCTRGSGPFESRPPSPCDVVEMCQHNNQRLKYLDLMSNNKQTEQKHTDIQPKPHLNLNFALLSFSSLNFLTS